MDDNLNEKIWEEKNSIELKNISLNRIGQKLNDSMKKIENQFVLKECDDTGKQRRNRWISSTQNQRVNNNSFWEILRSIRTILQLVKTHRTPRKWRNK